MQAGDPYIEIADGGVSGAFKTDAVVGFRILVPQGSHHLLVKLPPGGAGIEIDVSLVPQRDEGMTPYEIMLSESQERMLIIVEEGREEEVQKIFDKWDIDAVKIGKVTDDGMLRILNDGVKVAEVPAASLAEGAPILRRPSEKPKYLEEANSLDINKLPLSLDYNEVLKELIGSPNICSREWIYSQFDYMVRTDTVVPPGSDSAVLRIKETNKGIALTIDCNSRYCYLDPFEGGKIAVAEAARNIVCSGANH